MYLKVVLATLCATCLSLCMQHCEGITGTRAVISGHAHAALPLSVFTMCCVWVQQAKAYLRRRGGVNLRNPWGVCLAELPTLCCAPLLLALLWLMWKFLALAWAVITLPLEDGGPPSGFSEGAQTHSNMQAFQEGHFSAALDPQQSSSAHL